VGQAVKIQRDKDHHAILHQVGEDVNESIFAGARAGGAAPRRLPACVPRSGVQRELVEWRGRRGRLLDRLPGSRGAGRASLGEPLDRCGRPDLMGRVTQAMPGPCAPTLWAVSRIPTGRRPIRRSVMRAIARWRPSSKSRPQWKAGKQITHSEGGVWSGFVFQGSRTPGHPALLGWRMHRPQA
jgi:hypothetical protein